MSTTRAPAPASAASAPPASASKLDAVSWLDDPRVLITHATIFWPRDGMNATQRSNAISRFILYASIALALYYSRVDVLAAGLVACIAYAYFFRGETYAPFVTVPPASRAAGAGGPGAMTMPPPVPRTQTALNPYGNPLVGETPTTTVTPFDGGQATHMYYAGLPRDTLDVWDRNTAPWNFSPLPDRKGYPDFSDFAKTLYSGLATGGTTCKTDPRSCSGFEQ